MVKGMGGALLLLSALAAFLCLRRPELAERSLWVVGGIALVLACFFSPPKELIAGVKPEGKSGGTWRLILEFGYFVMGFYSYKKPSDIRRMVFFSGLFTLTVMVWLTRN